MQIQNRLVSLVASFLMVATSTFVLRAHAGQSSGENPEIKEGVYLMSGTFVSDPGNPYKGTVSIRKSGDDYKLSWKTKEVEFAEGIGFFKDDIFTVSFKNIDNAQWGIVQYKRTGKNIFEGPWRTFQSTNIVGSEKIEFSRVFDP